MAFEIKNGVLNKYNAESGEIRVIVPDEVTKIRYLFQFPPLGLIFFLFLIYFLLGLIFLIICMTS